MDKQEQALSGAALDLLKQLRLWAGSLPPNSGVVHENHNPGYGGLLFEVRPARPESVALAVGLGGSEDVDFFWGDGYRWEGWKASVQDVLEVCEAIKQGDVIEETWRLGPFVLEWRSYIGPDGHRAGAGSPPVPKWVKRWARLSVRKYSSWLAS